MVQKALDKNGSFWAELDRRAKEIEWLRAALQRIADEDVDPDLKGRADILMGIAWAALEHKSR